jgi:hypothetical protein
MPVKYGYERNHESKLMVFERKVLGKIFCSTKKEMVHGGSKQTMN